MTKPQVIIAHEYVPECYESRAVWIVIHAKPSQKVFEDSLRDIINTAIEAADYEVEVKK